jgi:hypothetical protein
LFEGKGKILKRGADAPLKHPHIFNPEQSTKSQREEEAWTQAGTQSTSVHKEVRLYLNPG